MIITKTSAQASAFKAKYDEKKQIANMGCHKCPCCGETKTSKECANERRKGGISTYKDIDIEFPLLILWLGKKYKVIEQDYYTCWTCGAEWKSEKYSYFEGLED